MKRKILLILLPVLAVVFLLAGIYGAVMVYGWAEIKDAEFQAEIAKKKGYTSYHPERIYVLVLVPFVVGGLASTQCLHYLRLLRRNEIPQTLSV